MKQQLRHANMAAIEEAEEDEDDEEEVELEVNRATSKSSSTAAKAPAQSKVNAIHPGDPRRVLSSKGRPSKAAAPRQANTVEFCTDAPSYSANVARRASATHHQVQITPDSYWANQTQLRY